MGTPQTVRIDCFGGRCSVTVDADGPRGSAREAARWATDQLLVWHEQFSRFLPGSELSRLNADTRDTVPATPLMLELAAAVRLAGAATGGVVDATLLTDLEIAGYAVSRPHADRPTPLRAGGDGEPPAAAGASAARAWATIEVDREAGTITRPPGVRIDSGGLVKGLLADVLCGWLDGYDDVVVDCCGDVRFGGESAGSRDLEVAHPFGGVAATLDIHDGAVATSGTTGRRWTGPDGHLAHHLIDPSTGRPARTGLCQVTALAPTALEAEVLAKWALLSGPSGAASRLVHGGVIVDDSGAVHEVGASTVRLATMGRASHRS